MSFDPSKPMYLGEYAAHMEIEALAQVILETGMEQHEPGDCECRRSLARLVEIAHERTVDRERLDWLLTLFDRAAIDAARGALTKKGE